jgi:hypothetical protein
MLQSFSAYGTNETLGISEALMAQGVVGTFWGLTAAQPMIVPSLTGPMFVFETALHRFIVYLNLADEYLTIRVWICKSLH